MRWTRTIAGAFLAAALAGCATTEPAAVLAGGARMIDLYRGTAAEPAPADRGAAGAARQAEPSPEGDAPAEREAPEGAVVEGTCRWGWFRWRCEAPAATPPAACACGDAPAYARTAANELELLFPRLPNPDIFIYVPAHFATELRIPVPGYTTAVPLYDRVEYALPGEEAAVRPLSEAPPGVSPQEAQPGASPVDARLGANAEEGSPGASAEESRPGASPQEARLGANAEEASPGSSRKEARPDPTVEEAP